MVVGRVAIASGRKGAIGPIRRQDIALGVDGAQFGIAVLNVMLGRKHGIAARISGDVIIKLDIGTGIEDQTQTLGDASSVAEPGERAFGDGPAQQRSKRKCARGTQSLDIAYHAQAQGRAVERYEIRAMLPDLGMRGAPGINFRAQKGDLLGFGKVIGEDRVLDPVAWSVQQGDFDLAIALNHEVGPGLADANKVGQSILIDIDIEIEIGIIPRLREACVELPRQLPEKSSLIKAIILATQEKDLRIAIAIGQAYAEILLQISRLFFRDHAANDPRAIADADIVKISARIWEITRIIRTGLGPQPPVEAFIATLRSWVDSVEIAQNVYRVEAGFIFDPVIARQISNALYIGSFKHRSGS